MVTGGGGRKNKEGSSNRGRKQRTPLKPPVSRVSSNANPYLRRAIAFHERKREFLVKLIVRLACTRKLTQFIQGPDPTGENQEAENDARVGDSHTHAEVFAEWDDDEGSET